MGRMQLHEEEAIVWNKKLQQMLDKKAKIFEKMWKIEDSPLNSVFERYYFQEDKNDTMDLAMSDEDYCKLAVRLFTGKMKMNGDLKKLFEYFVDHGNKEKQKEMLKIYEVNSVRELWRKIKIIETMWEHLIKESPDIEVELYLKYLAYCYFLNEVNKFEKNIKR